MPNGGITPDCVHCGWIRGRLEEGLSCGKHGIKVVVPIWVFCKEFVDAEGEGDEDWLDQELDRSELEVGQMYIWLGDDEVGFRHVPLTSIADYGQWTYQKVLEEIAKLT